MQGNRFEIFSPAVLQLARTVQYLKSSKMAEYGLKGTNALCLCRILDSKEAGLTATELARVCEIDKAQVSRCMAELTEKGFVFRNDMEGRRYKQKYHLTEEGRAAAEDIDAAAKQVQKTIRKGITAEELDSFYRTLNKICDNFAGALEAGK
ncbi:MAG: MarR family transcriptional regulator [Clostridia bacterium]|nr:MarR family transcriptional regulator [Clostridia bacterium]